MPGDNDKYHAPPRCSLRLTLLPSDAFVTSRLISGNIKYKFLKRLPVKKAFLLLSLISQINTSISESTLTIRCLLNVKLFTTFTSISADADDAAAFSSCLYTFSVAKNSSGSFYHIRPPEIRRKQKPYKATGFPTEVATIKGSQFRRKSKYSILK